MRLNSNENVTRRCKRGIIVYAKNEIANAIQFCDSKQIHVANKTLEYLTFKLNDLSIMVLYRNNNFSVGSLNEELNNLSYLSGNEKSIIIGDFNICRQQTVCQTERNLKDKGFNSLISMSTTKSTTQIDWCLSNIDSSTISAKTYETIHSYHDAICVSILR